MTNNPMVMFPLSASGGGVDPDAMHYKGSVAQASDLPANPDPGDTYKASAAFTLDGEQVEAGDILIWNDTDSAWDIYQGNITGAVSGPSSSTDGHLAVFDGTSGKLIKDGGAQTHDWYIPMIINNGKIEGRVFRDGEIYSDNIPGFKVELCWSDSENYQNSKEVTPTRSGFHFFVTDSVITSHSSELLWAEVITSAGRIYKQDFVRRANSITSGDKGFTTGDQVYGYAEAKANKSTSITAQSTDVEYPSALAVKTYVDNNGFNPSSMETVTETAVLSYPQGQIASGNTGLVTGGQIYDYVSTQIGNIETLLAQI